jgi:hypothetical protein
MAASNTVPLCRISVFQTNYFCTYDLYSPVHNVLDACISITRASGRGWALEVEGFLDPVKWHRADRRVLFGAQKTRDANEGAINGEFFHCVLIPRV